MRFARVLPVERRRLVRDELAREEPPERRDALFRADPRDDLLREADFRDDPRDDVPLEERLLDFRAVLLRDELPPERLRDPLRDELPLPDRLRELELDLRAAIGLPPVGSDDRRALRVALPIRASWLAARA